MAFDSNVVILDEQFFKDNTTYLDSVKIVDYNLNIVKMKGIE